MSLWVFIFYFSSLEIEMPACAWSLVTFHIPGWNKSEYEQLADPRSSPGAWQPRHFRAKPECSTGKHGQHCTNNGCFHMWCVFFYALTITCEVVFRSSSSSQLASETGDGVGQSGAARHGVDGRYAGFWLERFAAPSGLFPRTGWNREKCPVQQHLAAPAGLSWFRSELKAVLR